jgi:protein-S-isoprenylcysteine O-methyltransferase Ste14
MLPEVLPLSSDPAPWRAVGVVLFTVGLATALLGRIQLGNNWSDIEIAAVRREHRVVSRGIYGFVRHPIYSGDLLLLLGLQLALHSWLVVLPILLIPVVARQAVREERDLAAKLPGYDLYCRRTKRFIPFLA